MNDLDNNYYCNCHDICTVVKPRSKELAFGAYMVTDTGTIELTSTPVNLTFDLPSSTSKNINFDQKDAITIIKSGAYRVDIFLSGVTLNTTNVNVNLAINNVANNDVQQVLEFTAVNTGTFALVNYLTLTSGDELSIQMSSIPNTTFSFPPTGVAATLSVMRIF